jgi:predicted Rossmann-fold nucleotide-binding protein
MYHLIEKAYARMKSEGKKPSRDAYDYACYAIAPITDLAHPLVVTATTEDEIVAQPKYYTKIGYSEDFLKLKGNSHPSKNMTPNFMAKHSAMAMAIATMSKITGLDALRDIKIDVPALFKDYAQSSFDNRQGRWRIGMPQSSSLLGSEGAKASSLRVINQGFQREFALVAGHKDYDLGTEHSFTVLSSDGSKMPWYSSLVSADRFAKEVDAFYFRPIGEAKDMMEEFARDFSFFTPIVGKQTFGPHYHPKPNVVDVRYAKRQMGNYDYLHMLGLIGDAPVYLMDAVGSKSEAQRVLSRKLKEYVRPDDVDVPLSVDGEVPDGLFRIVVYASASNRGEAINAEAFRLGELSGQHGFSAINGGGNDGLMKSYADGVVKYRKDERAAQPSHIVVNGLTSIQCIDTIESEGEYPHADRKERHPTIFHRMDKLQENDAEIFLAGGAGTLQEFYATCMARLRTGRIENRPLILVNQDIRNGDETYKVWDKLIASLPNGAIAACNIHIVHTVEEAMDICIKARAKRGMAPIMKLNPYLTANENSFGRPREPLPDQPKVA